MDYRESAPYLRGRRAHPNGSASGAAAGYGADAARNLPSGAGVLQRYTARADSAAAGGFHGGRAQTVRVEAVRAVAEMEGEEAALVLRLKARVGDRESARDWPGIRFPAAIWSGTRRCPWWRNFSTARKMSGRKPRWLWVRRGWPGAVEILLNALSRARDPTFAKRSCGR